MIKQILEVLTILPSPPSFEGGLKAPVVHLEDGLALDDSIWEAPTLLLGSVGSGKSMLLKRIMQPILEHAAGIFFERHCQGPSPRISTLSCKPFFENAANGILFNSIMAIYEEAIVFGLCDSIETSIVR